MHDRKLVGSWQRSLSSRFILPRRERPLLGGKKKLRLLCKEIPYMGHLITADGLKPDPGKIDAVRNMPKPKDVKAVK